MKSLPKPQIIQALETYGIPTPIPSHPMKSNYPPILFKSLQYDRAIMSHHVLIGGFRTEGLNTKVAPSFTRANRAGRIHGRVITLPLARRPQMEFYFSLPLATGQAAWASLSSAGIVSFSGRAEFRCSGP